MRDVVQNRGGRDAAIKRQRVHKWFERRTRLAVRHHHVNLTTGGVEIRAANPRQHITRGVVEHYGGRVLHFLT